MRKQWKPGPFLLAVSGLGTRLAKGGTTILPSCPHARPATRTMRRVLMSLILPPPPPPPPPPRDTTMGPAYCEVHCCTCEGVCEVSVLCVSVWCVCWEKKCTAFGGKRFKSSVVRAHPSQLTAALVVQRRSYVPKPWALNTYSTVELNWLAGNLQHSYQHS